MIKRTLQIYIISILILSSSSCICGKGDDGGQDNGLTKENITLNFWSLFDNKDVYEPIINYYNQDRSNIHVDYQKKELAEYENELLNAIASSNPPDVFVIRNDWLPKHKDKLAPAPKEMISTADIQKDFADVVTSDFIQDDQVWALPNAIESLALFYNTSHFDEFQLFPPKTWDDFVDVAKKLTKKEGLNVTRAGIAMGNSSNTEEASDIVTLLMLQNLKQYNLGMTSDDHKSATFHLPTTKKGTGEQTFPGTEALNFYTSFARPDKETYCWNNNMPPSYQAFLEGKASMMIDYPYRVKYLKDMNPTLNFEITEMPQIKGSEKTINYGTYWAFAVSKDSKHIKEAWDFIKYITSTDMLRVYSSTNRPSSRKETAEEFKDTSYYGPFNAQVKTMVSWYKGKYPEKIAPIFNNMIDSVVNKNTSPQTAADQAAAEVTKLLQSSQ